ncbi:uncharacterized protein KLLA0_C12023g [Kluyveromyces lactis]|uniref:KLLA0C12023p n=1 Tax=Kluyveromyces lactis (strain ATCC 8585 / CBS 2359 / DSM 70799 / NBRC 1267 / NRRL Y-1140 / WM37) TaxID=284590 RepID=Q6CTK2_KLULA|nr:uncharacterized protein KLLA0_C12023g [Kluyveromyces lactis]CAH01588.1 KLLA0C12023p [Kluyveromyces lactis]|eukprot:XP_452737.1 uncharacterized protein KLLA0_C12023g [Kluyveromyces lactis]
MFLQGVVKRLVRDFHVSRICNEAKRFPFELLNLKVGKFQQVALHPNSEKMYVSQVELGNGSVKQICSGIRQYIPRDQLQDKLCIVVDNIKKCKLRGEPSEAMILCGEHTDAGSGITSVKLAYPVAESLEQSAQLVGQQVVIDLDQKITDRKIKPKKWDCISSSLYTNGNGEIVFQQGDSSEKQLFVKLGDQLIPVRVDGLPEHSTVR